MGSITKSFKNMVLKPALAFALITAAYAIIDRIDKTTTYRTVENAQFVKKNWEFRGPDDPGPGTYADATFQKGDSVWKENISTECISGIPGKAYDDLKKEGQNYTLTIKKGPLFLGERLIKAEPTNLEPVTDLNELQN